MGRLLLNFAHLVWCCTLYGPGRAVDSVKSCFCNRSCRRPCNCSVSTNGRSISLAQIPCWQAPNSISASKAGAVFLQYAKEKPDEICMVAKTLETLMDTVFQREVEGRAYLETLNLLEEVVIELDMNGHIRGASSAWHRMSGAVNDLAALPAPNGRFQDLLHPDDTAQMQTVLGTIATREKLQITLRARLRGEGALDTWVECRFVSLHNPAGQHGCHHLPVRRRQSGRPAVTSRPRHVLRQGTGAQHQPVLRRHVARRTCISSTDWRQPSRTTIYAPGSSL